MPLSVVFLLFVIVAILIALIGLVNRRFFKGKYWFVIIVVIGIIFIGSWIFFWQKNLETTYTEKYHEPDPTKNKVAVVIGKEGIYDSERVASQVSEYFKAVRKDLGIENAGLKKFEGKTLNDISNSQFRLN